MLKQEKDRLLSVAIQIAQIAEEIVQREAGDESDSTDSTRERVFREACEQFENFKCRLKHLSAVPTHDPGLGILLELFMADETGRKLSVTSIGLEQGVPMGTLNRWLSVLCDTGFVQRKPDDKDRRRVWMLLTDLGRESVIQYLQQCLKDADRIAKAA
jgi:DNA-binding MarR family transcriptional regulator